MNGSHFTRFVWLLGAGLLVVGWAATGVADETHARYFEQLRRRGLYSLAEGYAISRLAQANTPPSQRTELAIELSRTLAEHAGYASDQQRDELWKRARAAVDDERNRDPDGGRAILLAVQAAMVPASEGGWLRIESQLRPFDEPLAHRARLALTQAIDLLRDVERRLSDPPRAGTNIKSPAADILLSHELRSQLHQVRFQLASSLQDRAELSPVSAQERSVDLVDAETTFRKLIGVADEPLSFRAKLGLSVCARLKSDWARAHELLTALEKGEPRSGDELEQAVIAERVRLLLDRDRAADAAELIVQLRSKQKRLTGELWLLQVQALAAMRDAALQGKDDKLADQLREQAEITLQRCDEQVGGIWSRRCRMAWEAIRTAEKYGPALDAAMQQARADFLAGRIDAALAGYAGAERSAVAAGHTDLAVELGYTRASILLREKQFEPASAEFQRLVRDFPRHPRAAAAHLNAAYCLGRLYEEKRTQTRREAYTAALDRQVELFGDDSTADEARYLKGLLEEQRLQASAALPLYLSVAAGHSRAAEAHAGAARCYEALFVRMRERQLPTAEFLREAIETLTTFVPAADHDPNVAWLPPHAEVALHLAALLLHSEPPRFDQAERLLTVVLARAREVAEDDEQLERWRRLRQRAAALRVVALAGNGRPREAEQLVNSLAAASPRDLLAIVERLAPFVASDDRERRLQYVELQLRAAALLNERRETLSPADRESLDRCFGRAYLASGQIQKAVELYRRMSDEAPKDAARQREIALLLEASDQRECRVLALDCWRRAESLTKQGTPEWLTARLGVIAGHVHLGRTDEARKLLVLTRLLYPELGGQELKSRFTEVERRLEPSATKAEAER